MRDISKHVKTNFHTSIKIILYSFILILFSSKNLGLLEVKVIVIFLDGVYLHNIKCQSMLHFQTDDINPKDFKMSFWAPVKERDKLGVTLHNFLVSRVLTKIPHSTN